MRSGAERGIRRCWILQDQVRQGIHGSESSHASGRGIYQVEASIAHSIGLLGK